FADDKGVEETGKLRVGQQGEQDVQAVEARLDFLAGRIPRQGRKREPGVERGIGLGPGEERGHDERRGDGGAAGRERRKGNSAGDGGGSREAETLEGPDGAGPEDEADE